MPGPTPPPQRRTLRVLIVEDDPHVRHVLRRILEGRATDVLECANGADALGVYTSFEPDVVLMDIRLPGIDGLTATRRIRAAFRPRPC
jgi:two-component system, OmpR family, response regulator MprA